MRGTTFAVSTEFVIEECCNCGIAFGLTRAFKAECQKKRGPSGNWSQVDCDHCGGAGLVQGHTSRMGGDGPDECRYCNGSGHVWQSPKGRLAQWPGGPFIGRAEAPSHD